MEGEGGPWTNTKLKKVHGYLKAYQDVMLNQSWETIYIDAFCGSGEVKLRGARDFTEGSALQAIGLERPFHRYHLIEKSQNSLRRLKDQVCRRFPNRKDRVTFHPGDVNVILPNLISQLTKQNRAVIFADPKGMQLNWNTVLSVASKPVCDFWLLVPTGMGLERIATNDQKKDARKLA